MHDDLMPTHDNGMVLVETIAAVIASIFVYVAIANGWVPI